MIGHLRTALIFAVVSLALVVTGANYTKHQDVLRHLERTEEEKRMQTMESTWMSGGVTMTVKTPRKEGETATVWMTRHMEGFNAAKAVLPVDPPAGG